MKELHLSVIFCLDTCDQFGSFVYVTVIETEISLPAPASKFQIEDVVEIIF